MAIHGGIQQLVMAALLFTQIVTIIYVRSAVFS